MKKVLLLTAIFASATAFAAPLAVTAKTTGPDFMANKAAAARLSKLLGSVNFNMLKKDISANSTISTLQNSATVAAFTGCQSKACGVNDAIIIYDRKNDALKVVMHVNQKTRTFVEKGKFSSANFNNDVKAYLNNF